MTLSCCVTSYLAINRVANGSVKMNSRLLNLQWRKLVCLNWTCRRPFKLTWRCSKLSSRCQWSQVTEAVTWASSSNKTILLLTRKKKITSLWLSYTSNNWRDPPRPWAAERRLLLSTRATSSKKSSSPQLSGEMSYKALRLWVITVLDPEEKR